MNAASDTTGKLQHGMNLGQTGLEIQTPYFPTRDGQSHMREYLHHLEREKFHANGKVKSARGRRTKFSEGRPAQGAFPPQIAANVTRSFSRENQRANLDVRQGLAVNQEWDGRSEGEFIQLDA